MIREIIAAVVVLSGVGGYLYLRGERLLDSIIERQKRRKGGYFKKIKINEWCPGCGHRAGDIVWNPELERVIHNCQKCGATWPEKPRVPAHAWDVLGKMIKFNRESAQDVKDVFTRANVPIELKQDKSETN